MKKPQVDHPFFRQIQFDIDRIGRKADFYRGVYYTLRLLLIGFATVVTIMSGLKTGMNQNCIFNILLFVGAGSTAVTAIDTLFQVETKKNNYRLMLVELREIRSELVFHHEHVNTDLNALLKEKLFPKYQSVMAYSKTLLGKESESQDMEMQPS